MTLVYCRWGGGGGWWVGETRAGPGGGRGGLWVRCTAGRGDGGVGEIGRGSGRGRRGEMRLLGGCVMWMLQHRVMTHCGLNASYFISLENIVLYLPV